MREKIAPVEDAKEFAGPSSGRFRRSRPERLMCPRDARTAEVDGLSSAILRFKGGQACEGPTEIIADRNGCDLVFARRYRRVVCRLLDQRTKNRPADHHPLHAPC